MGNRLENQDHLLRYSAFALVWIAQLRDNYWCVGRDGDCEDRPASSRTEDAEKDLLDVAPGLKSPD